MAERFSFKMHGTWVRQKEYSREGRISYYDRKTDLVWVLWEPSTFTLPSGETIRIKIESATGVPPKELVKLTKWEPDPWFDFEKIQEARRLRGLPTKKGVDTRDPFV